MAGSASVSLYRQGIRLALLEEAPGDEEWGSGKIGGEGGSIN